VTRDTKKQSRKEEARSKKQYVSDKLPDFDSNKQNNYLALIPINTIITWL
jgi:hypothetical protein